jgi:hypothetical protein
MRSGNGIGGRVVNVNERCRPGLSTSSDNRRSTLRRGRRSCQSICRRISSHSSSGKRDIGLDPLDGGSGS